MGSWRGGSAAARSEGALPPLALCAAGQGGAPPPSHRGERGLLPPSQSARKGGSSRPFTLEPNYHDAALAWGLLGHHQIAHNLSHSSGLAQSCDTRHCCKQHHIAWTSCCRKKPLRSRVIPGALPPGSLPCAGTDIYHIRTQTRTQTQRHTALHTNIMHITTRYTDAHLWSSCCHKKPLRSRVIPGALPPGSVPCAGTDTDTHTDTGTHSTVHRYAMHITTRYTDAHLWSSCCHQKPLRSRVIPGALPPKTLPCVGRRRAAALRATCACNYAGQTAFARRLPSALWRSQTHVGLCHHAARTPGRPLLTCRRPPRRHRRRSRRPAGRHRRRSRRPGLPSPSPWP